LTKFDNIVVSKCKANKYNGISPLFLIKYQYYISGPLRGSKIVGIAYIQH